MPGAKRRGQRGHHAERGRDRGDRDLAGKAFLERVDFLPHRPRIADDPPRPVQRPLALGGKALEPGAALHQHDPEDFLELFEAGRHRRLGDAARLRGTAEMPFLGQRQQQFKLVDQVRPFPVCDNIASAITGWYRLSVPYQSI